MGYLSYILLLFSATLTLSSNHSDLSWDDIAKKPVYFDVNERNEVMYAKEALNIRELPYKSSKRLGILMKNDKVDILGYTSVENWVQIKHNDGVAYVNSAYLSYKKEVKIDTTKKDLIKEEDSIEIPKFIELDKDIDKDYVTGLLSYWEKIPKVIRTKFESDGSKIVVTNKNLGELLYKDKSLNILAVTVFNQDDNNCVIYMKGIERAKKTILHEIGHYVDGKLGGVCKGDFEIIWTNELQNFRKFNITADENVNTSHEYFAESFNMYLMNSDKLKQNCPYTFKYLKYCIRRCFLL